ncbi:MAG: hypothetical protein MUC65_03320 [Pontiellaceae bacterium]|jgi:hypothetical protein|nr:hypothetical protein [Pontiellaceae bacterium]
MIDMQQSREAAERQVWSGAVRKLFRTMELHDCAAAPEIMESLAVFCQQHPRITGRDLSLLMARSFCVAGDAEAAVRILQHDRAHRRYAGVWLEVLSSGYPFPELYPLFSSRAVYPQRLMSAGVLWALDFNKVQLTEADRHEVILFQTVRVLTEQVSNVWKKSNGGGTLGVKGLSRLTGLIGKRNRPDRLFRHIGDVLALCAQKNGWNHVPSVLCLSR